MGKQAQAADPGLMVALIYLVSGGTLSLRQRMISVLNLAWPVLKSDGFYGVENKNS